MDARLAWALAAALLGGCAVQPPAVGGTQSDVLRLWGPPTGRYSLPDGQQRLEYATGPYGRTTWMVDIDASGRVMQARQVLNEAEFLAVQTQAALGLEREALLRWLGRPGETRSGGRQGGQVWSWRYPTNDCLWFQVSVGDNGQVQDGGYYVDPACDRPSDGRQ